MSMKKILCWIFGHKWACDAEKGIKPYPGQPFRDYARMYCDKCGITSRLSL